MIEVLDKGYVKLRDVMGDDLTVVNAARVSFAKESEWALSEDDNHVAQSHWGRLKEADAKLIAFLAKSKPVHWSPFAQPKISLEVKAPIMVVNQWYKTVIDSLYAADMHAWNEVSRRYVTMEPEFYIPDHWQEAPEHRKQGSGADLSYEDQNEATSDLHSVIELGSGYYDKWLERNMAPQQARGYLPYAFLYTSFYWTASLWTIIRWLKERLDEHAQWEIRQYAQAVADIVRPLFPQSFAAHNL